MLSQPLPVVPAAHYACGGVLTDTFGRSSLPGLSAVGEVACTGVHGANRLASNSLLEALVFAARAAEQIGPGLSALRLGSGEAPTRLVGKGTRQPDYLPLRDEVRQLMWEKVGIVRTDERLVQAATGLADLAEQFRELAGEAALTHDLLELRNLIQTGALIIASSRARKESRGLNCNLDHPYRDSERYLHDTISGL
jgi:L-aspartate oxidase